MNIECNECRQRLSDALDETADTTAPNALAEHLAGCDSCRAELKLMQAARAELRALPILAAPADLRSRVRAQVEAAPVAAEQPIFPTAQSKIITAPANIKSTPGTEPRKIRRKSSSPTPISWRDRFRALLNHSTTITWASCCVLLAVYFVSLSQKPQPSGPYEVAERAPIGNENEKPLRDSEATEKAIQPSPSASAPAAKILPKPAVPGNPAPPVLPAPPSDAPLVTKPNPPAETSSGAKPIPFNPQRPPTTQNQKSGTLPLPAPPAPKPDRNSGSVSSTNGEANSNSTAKARARNDGADKTESSLSAPAPSSKKQKNNDMARSIPSSAREAAPAAIASADQAPESSDAAATVARDITTRIKPPRSLGWSQVSVVLSGGASFDDGQKSRVIWSGSAQAGEPIELSFSVQSTGGGTAKISLQEVKSGQAQTVAYKTVGVGASR